MSLQAVDALVLLGVFVATAAAAWRSWQTGLVVGFALIWIGLAVWGGLLAALDDQRDADVVDGVWLATGWVVPLVLVGAVSAVHRTVRAGRTIDVEEISRRPRRSRSDTRRRR